MRPRPHRAARRLAALLVLLACCAPAAHAAPSDELRAERDALAEQDARLRHDLARAEDALARGRARLDRAAARNRAARSGLERRLRALYAAPQPDPLIEILTGGDLDSVRAGLDLLEAVGQADRRLVAGYRVSIVELRAAEAGQRRHKDRLVEARRRLGVERRLVSGRLDEAVRAETPIEPDPAPVLPAPLTTGGGLTVPTPLGTPSADAPEPGTTRGLPAAFLEGRTLPGEAPVDAQSGQPVDAEPVAPAPDVTRAYPGLGALGPATGAPITGNLPTFTAVASWYGPGFVSERLASGEPYDPAAFSVASRTLRLGTMLRIGYGGRVVTVRVNDRGPYVRGRDLELSQAAAAALGLPGIGTVTAQILPAYVGPAIRA